MKIRITFTLSILVLFTGLFAQKRPLDHNVYDNWKSISNPEVSKTGQLIQYQITPQEGDAIFEIKSKDNELLISLPRAADAKLTQDESFLIAKIKPTFEETRQAKIKKKKNADMPKDSLIIIDIQHKDQWKFPAVSTYKLAQNKNEYVAFLGADSTAILHLRNLITGDTLNFYNVDQYAWSPNENFLLFSKKSEAKDSLSTDAGLYIFDITGKNLKKISNGQGDYKELLFDDAGTQLAFLADKTPEKSLLKDFKLYYYTAQLDTARVLVSQQSVGMPSQWRVSGDGKLKFSMNGQKLFFGTAPVPKVKDTTLIDFEHAQVDIWHWKDDYIQPQQLANLKRDKSQNFLAVIYPSANRLVQLADDKFNRTNITDEADNEWILATSDFGKRIAAQWEGFALSDIYIISTISGQKKIVKENLNGYASISPKGDFVLYFDRETGNWYSYQISSGKTVLLNDGLPVNFVDEENDSPSLPSPYGIAGWSANGKDVYIYDRYDIWKFDLAGKRKGLFTNGEGRATQTIFRYIDLNPNDNPRYKTTIIPEKENIFITGFNEGTKYNGIYTIGTSKSRKPDEIFSGGYTFRNFKRGPGGETVIYTKENYLNSPDLYVSKEFKNELRLTDINPQQATYNWGTAEHVQWTTPSGFAAEGILYKPENFDPNKRYPIIAYFYEKLSKGLYSYQAPAPTPSRLNIPYYVSNEYLVFAPDIRYEIGYPGKSAEEYVNSGMRYLAQNPWVDSTKMAIQGQSWGGYQVAHLITRTNMYAAAWSGAPVVNMTSAYGGIRWQSGMSRQFQYEQTQSRIGKTLWEDRERYIENSPLFFLDRVTTPVAIMHNDNDGAVPWYQGIEMFTALRRLQKPVWLLNYNGDEHNLMKRQNRKDIQIRQAQFFDHFLKGKPAPGWLEHGVPAKEKGINWGFD
ncbi:S9 family peptidase [Sphingobacterium haloxyli]|uniref:Peptidase S9 n=1 Tax=Sphingobacterium haloxyli TaxID=2100533 RepID=A0A2S9J3W2_9SPHI|nr:prolyl oligopeptidase family serine peptidase [Sphingobacterium haloxyli]PRD47483.1 peptidase S9 [Sphingobacterium haloxyli]